jgi:uncharacterized protein (DUF2267 family)
VRVRYDDFVTRVAERGGYPDRDRAEQVVQVVLGVLADRLPPDGAEELAGYLPLPVGAWLLGQRRAAQVFGAEEFVARVAAGTGTDGTQARAAVGAVTATVVEAAGGHGGDLRELLPPEYALLVG